MKGTMMQNKVSLANIVKILVFSIIAIFLTWQVLQTVEAYAKKAELAKAIGVSLKDYPHLPDDYLHKVIVPGDTNMEDVHKVIVGYKTVFHSSSEGYGHYEIYYFFSDDENKADRILIVYDENYEVEKIQSEDDNSRTLTTGGWTEGLLAR